MEHRLFGLSTRYLERKFLDHYQVSRFNSHSRERAALLLARHLSGSQQRCLRARGFFIVMGASRRRFRIWARRQLPVELIDSTSSSPRHEPWLYCIHNDLSEGVAILPLADYLLELKLCLETAEEYFLVTSNPNFNEGAIEKNELVRRRSLAGTASPDDLRIDSG